MSERLKIFLLLLPALLVLGGLFGGGLLVAVLRSINFLPAFGCPSLPWLPMSPYWAMQIFIARCC